MKACGRSRTGFPARQLGRFAIGFLLSCAVWAREVRAGQEASSVPVATNFWAVRTNPAPYLHFRNRSLDDAGAMPDRAAVTNVDEVRFGWFGPSDPNDPLSGGMWWAANEAVREANEHGGVGGRPFHLIPKWSENPWGNGVPQVFRLAYEDQVWALLGGMDGASTHLAEQVVAKACLPLVNPVSTDKSVNLAGVPWMFSCAPHDGVIAETLVAAVLDATRGQWRELAVLSATDHDSRAAAKEILRVLHERQAAPGCQLEFAPGQGAGEPQLAALEAASPRVLLLAAGPDDLARWVVALRRRLPRVALFGTPQMARSRFIELAGPAGEGVLFPLLWTPDETDAATRHFSGAFQARFRRPPDYSAALSYDATRLLIEATRQAGPDPRRLRDALTKISPWRGIAGTVSWDGTGQNQRRVTAMGTVRGGRVETAP